MSHEPITIGKGIQLLVKNEAVSFVLQIPFFLRDDIEWNVWTSYCLHKLTIFLVW